MTHESTEIDELNIPDDLKYAESSEWLKVEGELGRVGISDFAQHELTDIVYVELPQVGAKIEKGKVFGVVESVKAVADFYAPLSGTVIEVNSELENAPQIMNKDPYGEGWMAVIKIENISDVETLMNAETYRDYLRREKTKLESE